METRSLQYTNAKLKDKLEITRVLDLNPEDWLFCTWRPRNPLPRPEPKPFNQDYLFQHLADITKKYRYIAAGTDFTPAIAKKTQLIEAATQFLRTMVKKGYEGIIRVALEQETDIITNKIKTEVLEHKEITSVPFDENNTPMVLTLLLSLQRKHNLQKQQLSFYEQW